MMGKHMSWTKSKTVMHSSSSTLLYDGSEIASSLSGTHLGSHRHQYARNVATGRSSRDEREGVGFWILWSITGLNFVQDGCFRRMFDRVVEGGNHLS
jgi:hypothetical protein